MIGTTLALVACVSPPPAQPGTAEVANPDDPYASNSHGPAPLDCPELSVRQGPLDLWGETATTDAEAFCDEYNVATGGVVVWGTDWEDLTALSCLCDPGSFFSVTENEALTSLRGLDHLHGNASLSVLVYDNPLLSSLEGLVDIQELYSFTVQRSNAMTTVDGFPTGMPTDRIEVQWLPNLQDFSAMKEWTVVPGRLTLDGLPYLTDLSPLENLVAVGSLSLTDLPITSLDGLGAIEHADYVKVEGSEQFVTVDGLANSVGIGGLGLLYLPSLERLTGFPAGLELPYLVIWDTSLTSLHGLQDVSGLERLSLIENRSLESLSGLPPSLARVGEWRIHDNPQLSDLSALSTVTYVDDLDMYGSNRIASIEPLGNVRTIDNVRLRDMPLLTDLTPLYGVQDISGYLWIQGSDAITEQDCEGLEAALDANGIWTYQDLDCEYF